MSSSVRRGGGTALREIFTELIALIAGRKEQQVGEGDGLKSFLVQGSVGTFSLRLASTALAFVMSVLLARLLGTEGYGVYTYAFAWSLLLVVVAVMGCDKLLVRYLAVYRESGQWGLLKGIVRITDHAVLAASSLLAAAAAVTAWLLMKEEGMRNAVILALLLLPVYSRLRLKQASLQGLRRVVIGQVPEMVIQPVLFLLMLAGAYVLFQGEVSAQQAVLLFVITAFVTMALLTTMLHRSFPRDAQEAVPIFETRLWLKTALPLLLIDSMYIINSRTDVIMLGAIKGPAPAGIYNVANRGAEFITFVLLSVNMVLAPTVAALYAQGDRERLQNIMTLAARAVLIFSLPVALALIFFGEYFLMIFGKDFMPGNTALSILSGAQLFSCSMGSVGLLLVMTGHERQAAAGVAVSAALNVLLNALLIPRWGIEGAAVSTGLSTIAWNAMYVIWVYKKLGYHTTALGKIEWLLKK